MDVIEAKFRIVTPMFISGADQTEAELRVPSIKGALRFWWRALNYKEDTKALFREESNIFGSSDQKVGQSKVNLRLKDTNLSKTKIQKKWGINDWRSYIGYGLSEDQSGKEKRNVYRIHINPGGTFSLEMSSLNEIENIFDALKLFSLLGGLGSRSRKGWGSVSIQEINSEWKIPESRDKYKEQLGELLVLREDLHQGLPKYSAISSETDVRVGPLFNDPNDAFQDIGEKYKQHLETLKVNNRAAFGLPRKGNNDRRSSPLLIHIHQCQEGAFWVCLFLRSHFNDKLTEPPGAGYKPVEDFLNNIGGDMI